MDKIEEIVEQSLLYDFYGELLTDNQRRIYEAVIFSDLSLSEVAEQEGITRQGIFDMVKRSEKALARYEEKLGMVKKFEKTKKDIALIKGHLADLRNSPAAPHAAIADIEKIITDIEETL